MNQYILSFCMKRYNRTKTPCVFLDSIKYLSQKVLEPAFSHQVQMCTLLLLSNLAEPEWKMVVCQNKLLNTVWCESQGKKEMHKSGNVSGSLKTCLTNQIAMQGACLTFHSQENRSHAKCKDHFLNYFSIKPETFYPILVAISAPLPPFVTKNLDLSLNLHQFSFKSQIQKVIHEVTLPPVNITHSVFMFTSGKKVLSFTLNIFVCDAGTYISATLLCDGKHDCPVHHSDEKHPLCKLQSVINGKQFMDNDPHRLLQHKAKSHGHFHCNNKQNTVIKEAWINDLVPDCGTGNEDESTLVNLLKYGMAVTCTKPHQISCREGHSQCFEMTDICKYNLDKFNHLTPCRNGGNIQECKEFQCTSSFKCESSFCIPWRYVCDGKWDCPLGYEESWVPICGANSFCRGMIKCTGTKHLCIHLLNACDEHPDCPRGEDELLCSSQSLTCPRGCECTSLLLKCDGDGTIGKFPTNYNFLLVAFHSSNNILLQSSLLSFPQSVYFSISFQNIDSSCNLTFPVNLIWFALEFTNKTLLSQNCIANHQNLTVIELAKNEIASVHSHSFSTLLLLKSVNLSRNPIPALPKVLFWKTPKMTTLSLIHTQILFVHHETLLGLSLSTVATSSYHICCLVQSCTVCTAEIPWYVSCSDLLPNKQLQCMFGSVTLLILLLNGLSFWNHIQRNKDNKTYSLTVQLVNFSDVLYSVYLCIILTADITYRGKFLVFEYLWKSSLSCLLAL